jgi:dipeptidase D
MKRMISHLQPIEVWTCFEDICSVPRPSKKEEKIIAFLKDFADKHKLDFKKDKAGNVLIKKKASTGYENRPTVILQSHLDMVCEKNSNVEHNFETDAIEPYIDGEWVKAQGTTLGADCGIGIAAQMAVLASGTINHGPLECFFTVDEETGLTGAFALEPGFMNGELLLNLDSEDEGELFIGCAGGIDTIASYSAKLEDVPKGFFPIEIEVSGLAGGHSGDDINRGRGNAIKILSRFLWDAYHNYGIRINTLSGGNLRNAIPREAKVILLVQHGYKENLVADFNVYKSDVSDEFSITEPGMRLDLGSVEMPGSVFDDETTRNLLNALFICPNGVQSMSYSMPGMVETSTNLASVKIKDGTDIEVTTSQRSDRESAKKHVSQLLGAVFENNGAVVRHSDGYPGWKPNPGSPLVKKAVESYAGLFGHEPLVRSIHAGLECGLFLAKYPHLDMVSFGPTIKNAHSPDEQLKIDTVPKFWAHLVALLEVL